MNANNYRVYVTSNNNMYFLNANFDAEDGSIIIQIRTTTQTFLTNISRAPRTRIANNANIISASNLLQMVTVSGNLNLH